MFSKFNRIKDNAERINELAKQRIAILKSKSASKAVKKTNPKSSLWNQLKTLTNSKRPNGINYKSATINQLQSAIARFNNQQLISIKNEHNKKLSSVLSEFAEKREINLVSKFLSKPIPNNTITISFATFIKIILSQNVNQDYLLRMGYVNQNGVKVYKGLINFEQISDIVNNFKTHTMSQEVFGSDAETILDIIDFQPNIELKWLLKSDNKYQKQSGAFFKYYHETTLDLTRYQVYAKKDKKDDESCLIHALKLGGLDNYTLNQLKLLVGRNDIPLANLTKVSKELDIRINLHLDTGTDSRSRKRVYNPNGKHEFNIGYLLDHYFLNETTKYTSSCIKHYETVKDHKLFPNVLYQSGKFRNNNDYISSFALLSLLLEKKELLTPITMGNCGSKSIEKIMDYEQLKSPRKACVCTINKDEDYMDQLVGLEDICDCKKDLFNEYKQCWTPVNQPVFAGKYKENNPNDDYDIIFADFETFNNGKQHESFCISSSNNNVMTTHYGSNCAISFLESIKKHSVIIFHNLGFDIRFLLKHLSYFGTPIESGNSMKHLQCMYKNIRLVFKDSYAFLPFKLSSLPKMFNLNSGDKDAYPYDLINSKNIESLVSIKVAKKHCSDGEQLEKNAIASGCVKDGKLDIKKYTIHYCEQDVRILAQAYTKFRAQILEITEFDIIKLISLPQLADNHFKRQGCYNDCFKFSGIANDFIRRCVVGGRVMVANNTPIHCKEVLDDFDAVSLYPSAMHRLPGYLKGLPKVLSEKQLRMFKQMQHKFDYYFIHVKITGVSLERSFPLCSVKTESGIRNFTNNLVGQEIYLDKVALEDLIEFQGVQYKIIRGYYFNNGFNSKIKDSINFMFNERKKLKEQKNNLQQAYKLILNASYGKLIQKPINKTKIFHRGDHDMYFIKNYNSIIEYSKIDDDLIVVSKRKSIIKSMSPVHLGVQVLSMSKRIMNEVMCLAEDNNISIKYQDTDSMHLPSKDIEKLAELFKKEHKRDLIGEDLGQFHSDFDAPGTDIHSTESIFLGKKSYADKLEYTDKSGNQAIAYHIRMKGIPTSVVREVGPVMETYKKLFDGETVNFDLTSACPLEMNKNYTVSNRKKRFIRSVKYSSISPDDQAKYENDPEYEMEVYDFDDCASQIEYTDDCSFDENDLISYEYYDDQ